MANVYDVDALRRKLTLAHEQTGPGCLWINGRFNPPIDGAVNVIVTDIVDSMSYHDPFFNIQSRHAMVDGFYRRAQ